MLVIEGEAVLDLGIAFEDCKEHFDTRNGAETVAKAPMYRLQGKSSMWVPAGKMLLLVPSDKQSAGEEQVENNEQDNVFWVADVDPQRAGQGHPDEFAYEPSESIGDLGRRTLVSEGWRISMEGAS